MIKRPKSKIKKRNFRKRDNLIENEDINEDDDKTSELIQEALEIRKLRRRPDGIEADELLKGDDKVKVTEEIIKEKDIGKETFSKSFSDENNAIVSSFKTQTNFMDTEKLMNKFIEDEIRKNRGEKIEKTGNDTNKIQNKISNDINNIYEIPENLKVEAKPIKEDNVTTSTSMLTTIQEVDLGIENKLKNIEETEQARKILEEEKKKKKVDIKNYVGTSVAAERFYNGRTNNRNFDFYNKNKRNEKQNNQNNDKQESTQISKNSIIAKINTINSSYSNQQQNKPSQDRQAHNDQDQRNRGNNMNRPRNYDKRTMATDDIAFERFKKRFRR